MHIDPSEATQDDGLTTIHAAGNLESALSAAVGLVEAGELGAARSLLMAAERAADALEQPRALAVCLSLLAQLDGVDADLDGAIRRAGAALEAAARTDDRELIHRCMALESSLRLLKDGRI
jgi:hypothetical protein